jgi:hypothetical protein
VTEIRERPPSTLKNIDGGPLGGIDGDPRAPTINGRNVDVGPPWEVVSEIREHPPSTLRNVDGGPPWEAVTEIRERSPSMQEMSTAGPLGGANRDSGASTINAKKR